MTGTGVDIDDADEALRLRSVGRWIRVRSLGGQVLEALDRWSADQPELAPPHASGQQRRVDEGIAGCCADAASAGEDLTRKS